MSQRIKTISCFGPMYFQYSTTKCLSFYHSKYSKRGDKYWVLYFYSLSKSMHTVLDIMSLLEKLWWQYSVVISYHIIPIWATRFDCEWSNSSISISNSNMCHNDTLQSIIWYGKPYAECQDIIFKFCVRDFNFHPVFVAVKLCTNARMVLTGLKA